MTDKEVEVANIMANINTLKKSDGTEVEKDDEEHQMDTIEMCELVKQGGGDSGDENGQTQHIETQLIQTTSANGQPQLIQVVTTTNSQGHLIATPVSQIQQQQVVHIAPQHIQVRRRNEITQSIVEDDDDDDQQYYSAASGQILPIKSELDNDEGTVELIPSMDDDKMEDVVIQNGEDETQHYIVQDAPGGQILTQQDITYVDVTHQQQQPLVIETPNSASHPKKRIIQSSQQVSNGQQKQLIMPANSFNQQQIIQIPGQNGQPGQMIIVPKGNIIVLPSNAEHSHGSGGFQTLQLVNSNQVIQSPPHQQQNQNQQQQILILHPEQNGQVIQQVEQVTQVQNSSSPSPNNGSVNTVSSKKSKSFKGGALEDAVMIAGIDQPSQRGASGQASVVSDRHHYPSPFSQVPVEERPHSCTFCYKRFARADECKRHERIHTDTRPFSCQYCPRRFTRKDHLRTHTRCHTKEKPYICPLCQRGFARSDERIRHVKTHVKKGEGTLEEIKAKMPKPRFEPKQKVRGIGLATGSPMTTQGVTGGQGQQVQLSLASAASPIAGDSGNQVTARIIQIPISMSSNGAQQIHIAPIQHE